MSGGRRDILQLAAADIFAVEGWRVAAAILPAAGGEVALCIYSRGVFGETVAS